MHASTCSCYPIYNGCLLTVCMCGGSEDEGGKGGGEAGVLMVGVGGGGGWGGRGGGRGG